MATPTRAHIFRSEIGSGSRWEVAVRAPAEPLRPYLPHYTGYREEAPGPVTRREVSGSRIVFILDLGSPILVTEPVGCGTRHVNGFVAGLRDSYVLTTHDGAQEGVQLDLSPVGARLLFGTPLAELTNQVIGVSDLGLPERNLVARLRSLTSWDARFDLLDRVLCACLGAPTQAGRAAAWAIDCIERARGGIDIRSLASDLGYSEKQVTRIFREHVGVGPKRFARIVRFDHLMRAARSQPDVRWAELALDFGFYDQAHLTREVKDLSGLTPTELRADASELDGLFR